MKAFGFLSASSAEIALIDHKLSLFQDIFQGTYEVATHAKGCLGAFGGSLQEIAEILGKIYKDPVYCQVSAETGVLNVVCFG